MPRELSQAKLAGLTEIKGQILYFGISEIHSAFQALTHTADSVKIIPPKGRFNGNKS